MTNWMNEHFYQEMIKSAPVSYAFHRMVCDEKGRPVDYTFLDVNATFESMTGVTAREVIGKRVTEVFPHLKEDPFDWIAYYGEVAAEGKTKEFEQYSEVLGKWYQVKAFSPEPGTFATFALDITQRVATEEQVREYNEKLKLANMELDKTLSHVLEANQVKSEFLANMSHEMRTPLNAVIGMGELALRETHDLTMTHYLKQMVKSGKSLLLMINDVLDYAQLEAGRLTIKQQVFSVNKIVQEVADTYASRAQQKSILLKVFVDEKTPSYLVGDETRLKQVLMNLLSNAVKFTYQGEITLSVNQVMENGMRVHLQFQVKDTGIGIPMEQVDKLFKPFSQADSSTTRQYEGTGLGLSISRQLVTLMGGNLWVVSQVDEGSTFTFQVPFESASDLLTSFDELEETLQVVKEEMAEEMVEEEARGSIDTLLDTLEKQLSSSSFIDHDVVIQMGRHVHYDPFLKDTHKTLTEALAVFDYERCLLVVKAMKNHIREVQP